MHITIFVQNYFLTKVTLIQNDFLAKHIIFSIY